MFYKYLSRISSHHPLIIACLKITLHRKYDILLLSIISNYKLTKLTSGRNWYLCKKKVLVLVNPSNVITNHVAVKFTEIWFPVNKFTQPALLYCMNETDGSISEVMINSSVVT